MTTRSRRSRSVQPSDNENKLRDEVLGLIQQFAGSANIVSCPIEFVRATGSMNRAAVLNQVVFWHGIQVKTGHDDGWFFKSYDEWERETGLNEFKIRTAAGWLEAQNLIERKLKKAYGAPTVHYRLIKENFTDWILEKLKNGNLTNCGFPVPAETKDSIKQISTSENTNRQSPVPPEGGKGDVVSFPLKNQNSKEPTASEDPKHSELMAYFAGRGGRNTRKQRLALTDLLSCHDPENIRKCFDYFYTLPTRQYAVTWVTVQTEIDQWLLRHGRFADLADGCKQEIADQSMRTLKEQIEHGEFVAAERGFTSKEFLEGWDVFAQWRAEHGNPLTPRSVENVAAGLAKFTEREAPCCVFSCREDGRARRERLTRKARQSVLAAMARSFAVNNWRGAEMNARTSGVSVLSRR